MSAKAVIDGTELDKLLARARRRRDIEWTQSLFEFGFEGAISIFTPKEVAEAAQNWVGTLNGKRDAEWTRLVLGINDGKILTPEEGAKWLETDRRRHVVQVVDATRFKGRPQHY